MLVRVIFDPIQPFLKRVLFDPALKTGSCSSLETSYVETQRRSLNLHTLHILILSQNGDIIFVDKKKGRYLSYLAGLVVYDRNRGPQYHYLDTGDVKVSGISSFVSNFVYNNRNRNVYCLFVCPNCPDLRRKSLIN
uniref:Uncharacterized protein n=1 Tax=Cacopsylla melanoneura TaxID=428564 RepID=A0A8D8TN93_9HEMI